MRVTTYHAWIVAALGAVSGPVSGASFWINEFHYDDAGSDDGEFVEVVLPKGFADLASVTLTLYNGGDGRSYGTHSLSTFTVGSSTDGVALYYKNIAGGIQNGAPDGLALSWPGGVQFLSYEGSFTAANGAAAGLTSLNIGVSESDPGTAAGSSLGLTGTGASYEGFSWTTFVTASKGEFNAGQTVVPEPEEYALGTAAGLAVIMLCRRRAATRCRDAR